MSPLPRRLLLAASLLLSACATTPPVAPAPDGVYEQHLQRLAGIQHFSVTGRIGVQTEKKGFSGKLRWQHAPDGDAMAFYSPLGAQVAEIIANAGSVTLTTSDRETYTAEDAETLLRDTMGWSLPLQGLTDWMLGRPAPGPTEEMRWDAQGRLTHLRQDGWNIEFPVYLTIDGTDLPGKIVLKSRQLDLKVLVEQWQTGEAQP